jgi:hypothetical protein
MSKWFEILKVRSGHMTGFMERLQEKFGGKIDNVRSRYPKVKLTYDGGQFTLSKDKQGKYALNRYGQVDPVFRGVYENFLRDFDMSKLDIDLEKEAGIVSVNPSIVRTRYSHKKEDEEFGKEN